MDLQENWVEALSVTFLVFGFILAVLLQNTLASYIAVFLSGVTAARIYYIRRYKEPILPFILIILGFFIGYFVGAFWLSRVLIFIFFFAGFGASYYLHLKKYLVIFKSKNFHK